MDMINELKESGQLFVHRVVHWAPHVLLAIVILIVGVVLAKIARFASNKILRLVNFHILTQRAGLDGLLEQGGVLTNTTGVVGLLIYWMVIITALTIAFKTLGLMYVTGLLNKVVLFVPRVILAVLILTIGLYFARFVSQALTVHGRNIGLEDAHVLGRIGQYAIGVFVSLVVLAELDVAQAIIRDSFLIVLSGITLALALAFGIGGQKWAARMLERQWPRKDITKSKTSV